MTLAASLPSSYKTAMQSSNGGEIIANGEQWNQYPIEDISDRRRTSRTCNHIVKETQALRSWPRFPAEALAIAGNGAGDQLVLLKVNNAYEDGVYLWSHETGLLTKVASDFAHLLP